MLRRRTTSPYLICSFVVHVGVLFMVWWLMPAVPQLVPFYQGIAVTITHVERPPVPVAPPKFVEPPVAVVEEAPKPPPPPKPKAGLTGLWQVEAQQSEIEARRQEKTGSGREVGDGLSTLGPVVGRSVEGRVAVKSVNTPKVEVPGVRKRDERVPASETAAVSLETDAALLAGASPSVDTPKIHYGSERGDALRATGVGNSWGGGGGGASGGVGGAFVYMMKDIAHTLVSASVTEKADVIFVLDETASMVDNIRGIRAYVDFLFEAFAREGRDATFGLVTFTDQTRTYGRTSDLGTFKNWLFKIGVDGGGDIAEAGLDGLMAAVTETQFREGAQRFILLASDGAFHDADYNGRSVYSLDGVIETLQTEEVRVDVIGIDYLPIRQIALATGGTWRAIPGRGYLEYVPPLTLTVKLFSKLGTLKFEDGQVDDKITVYMNNPPRPKALTLTWKVLNPLGERCFGPLREEITVPEDGTTTVEFDPVLDAGVFQGMPGVYTVIYRLENEHGHRSILRRTVTF